MPKINLFISISLLTLLLTVDDTFASKINASTFGYNPADATVCFQAAIQSSFDTVVVDLQTGDWNVGPGNFFNITNKTIIFSPGVTLRALPGAFNAVNACLTKFTNASNVTIIGYGAEFRMNKSEYAILNNSEYRMNISLIGCSNFTIKGLVINESGGDGIYIGGSGSNGFCEDIFIEDVRCMNHYRQGMSIISVRNMLVKNSYFTNTRGTQPEAGVDVEPNQVNDRIVNLRFENCAFTENGWAGFAAALINLDSTSVPVSIEINNCYFKMNGRPQNTYSLAEICLSANYISPVQGQVVFNNCFIDSSNYPALYSRKVANAYRVAFNNCFFKNVSQLQLPYNEPVSLEVPDYFNPTPYLGGFEFNDVFLSYQTNFSFFRVYGAGTLPGIKDLTGHFTVVEPNNNPPLYTSVPGMVNVTYTYTNQTGLPAAGVSMSVQAPAATECNGQRAAYTFIRSSSDISYPLGISYRQSGTVTPGDDVHLKPGGVVISANTLQASDTTVAREDTLTEGTETETIEMETSAFYQITGTNPIIILINDCNVTSVKDEDGNRISGFSVFPVPAKEELNIFFDKIDFTGSVLIQILDITGRVILTQHCLPLSNLTLAVSEFPQGTYIVRIVYEKGVYLKKWIKGADL